MKLLLCLMTVMILETLVAINSPYKGKKANFIGDSITRGSKSYVATVKEKLELSVARNYGIGGDAICFRGCIPRFKTRTFAGKLIDDAYPPVVSRWQKMDDDADIVFMLIGTNDYNSRVPIGALDSTKENEFNGCLNIVLPGLKAKYPGKLIIVSTILKRRGGGNLGPYNEAIKDACERYGIICYDAYNQSGLDFETEYKQGKMINTKDGLHPNPTGAKILGVKIAEFIANIPQKNKH